MKIKAKIVFIAPSNAKHTKDSVILGKPFDLIMETLSGPKRRLGFKIEHRTPETFAHFGLHLGQEQHLHFVSEKNHYSCRLTPAYSRYLSQKYRRKNDALSKQLNNYENEVFEAVLVDYPQYILKRF